MGTSTSTVDTVACTLILYSKTYHRGDKLELPSSEPDLSSSQLAGGPVSAQLTGQCCWELHSSLLGRCPHPPPWRGLHQCHQPREPLQEHRIRQESEMLNVILISCVRQSITFRIYLGSVKK